MLLLCAEKLANYAIYASEKFDCPICTPFDLNKITNGLYIRKLKDWQNQSQDNRQNTCYDSL